MSNPLMQMMGGAPTGSTGGMGNLSNIIRMLKSGNPEQIAQNLMQSNPQFRAFVEANRGKTPQQVAQEHGVDLGQLMKQM